MYRRHILKSFAALLLLAVALDNRAMSTTVPLLQLENVEVEKVGEQSWALAISVTTTSASPLMI